MSDEGHSVSCPSCSRANVSGLRKCLYCGAALVDEATLARERATALVARRARGRSGIVPVILPGQSDTANLEAVAALLECELYAARQALRRAGPLLLPGVTAGDLAGTDLDFVELDYASLDAIPHVGRRWRGLDRSR